MRGTDRLGIELLSVSGLDPVAHIHLAADLGCAHISTGLTQVPFDPHGYPAWSLRCASGASPSRWARGSACAPASTCATRPAISI